MFGFGSEEEKKVVEASLVDVFRKELKESLNAISEEYKMNLQAKEMEIEEYKRIIAYYEEAFATIRKMLVNQEKISDKSIEVLNSLQALSGGNSGDGEAE